MMKEIPLKVTYYSNNIYVIYNTYKVEDFI